MTGFAVFDRSPWADRPAFVLEWSIIVRGGDELTFPPAMYTSSTSSATSSFDQFLANAFWFSLYAQPTRRLMLGFFSGERPRLVLETTGSADRGVSDSAGIDATTPVVILTVNDERPPSRLVDTDTDFVLTVQIGSGGPATPLDWYWAIAVNDQVYWVTASGLSLTLAPVFQGTYASVPHLAVPFHAPQGTTITNFLAAVDASGIIAYDTITAVVSAGALSLAEK